MQVRTGGLVLAGMAVLFLASGCATMSKSSKQENQNLKVQVQDLQTQVQQKDAEIDSLRKSLSETTEARYAASRTARSQEVATEHPTVRQIQTALANAGFDPGSIDGKMGSATRRAIRDFQKAHDLQVDGRVGRKTWSVLAPYLERAAKQ